MVRYVGSLRRTSLASRAARRTTPRPGPGRGPRWSRSGGRRRSGRCRPPWPPGAARGRPGCCPRTGRARRRGSPPGALLALPAGLCRHPGDGVVGPPHGLLHDPERTARARLGGRSCTGSRLSLAGARARPPAADLDAVEVDRAHPVAEPGDVVGAAVHHDEIGAQARPRACPGRSRRRAARPPSRWSRAAPRAASRPVLGHQLELLEVACRGRRRRRRCPSRSGRRPRGRGARLSACTSVSAARLVHERRAGWAGRPRRPRSPRAARAAWAPARRPSASIRSIASSSRKMPCSMERTPLRSAALMPAGAPGHGPSRGCRPRWPPRSSRRSRRRGSGRGAGLRGGQHATAWWPP